jgi:hypothetical protein
MSEPIGIDSIFGGGTTPKAYSADTRAQVIGRVGGGASRREASGSISRLEAQMNFLLTLIEDQADLIWKTWLPCCAAWGSWQRYNGLGLFPVPQHHPSKSLC